MSPAPFHVHAAEDHLSALALDQDDLAGCDFIEEPEPAFSCLRCRYTLHAYNVHIVRTSVNVEALSRGVIAVVDSGLPRTTMGCPPLFRQRPRRAR